MDILHLAHIVFLCLWGGVVATESVIELSAKDTPTRQFVAKAHYWIDVLIELPLLVGVLVTGIALTTRLWPLTTVYWIKVISGLIPVVGNLICVGVVIVRYKYFLDDARKLQRYGQYIWYLFPSSITFAGVALYLGLSFLAKTVP